MMKHAQWRRGRALAAFAGSLGLLAGSAIAWAQDLESLREQPGTPEAMQGDLQTLRGYYGQVRQRTGNAASAPPVLDRDPFQVTAELRARRQRPGSAPGLTFMPPAADTASGEAGDTWRVQALLLGARPLAVLVRDTAAQPTARDGAGAAGQQRRARSAVREQARHVRVGDTLDMPDGRAWYVIGIDREGVLVRGSSADIDTLRIR